MDIIVSSPASTPMNSAPMNSESKQNGGTSPPVDDPPQPLQQQQQQRPTRYINNSSLVGGVSKANSRANSSTSSTTKNKSLVRSHAVNEESEETSPPPPDGVNNAVVSIINNNKNGKLRQQNSQQSSRSSVESSLSLDNNVGGDKQGQGNEDNELLEFIIETLNKNAKDRTLILRIETDLISFLKDPKKTSYNFPAMTSYQRMLVHRVSGYFHLEHNLDTSATGVVVTKTKSSRVPERRFSDYIDEQQQLQESNNKTIVLKRENAGARKSNDDQNLHGGKCRGKSLEERAEDYNRVRRRIFNAEQQHDPGAYFPGGWSSTESNTTNDPHGKQQNHIRHMNRRSHNAQPSSTLLKVESFETATINRKNKPPVVNKSYSFGGYGATDGSNVVVGASNNMGLNRFSKQDSSSSSSGLSPASSGYKSQSFQSSTENTMTTPNSSTSPQNLAIQEQPGLLAVEAITPQAAVATHSCVVTPGGQQQQSHQTAQPFYYYPASSSSSLVAASGLMQGVPLQMQPQPPPPQQQNPSQTEPVVLWAVTDMSHVPPGSVLIDPNSGQALKNSDGTMYHFDPVSWPSNPPKTVLSTQPQSSELVMYHGQPHHQQSIQQPQLVNTPGGDVDHMTQWFSHVGIQQPPPQQTHLASHQWGDEYYVTPPPQQQPSSASSYMTGAPPILWDPSKITAGAIGLNQQYYVNNPAAHHPPPPPPHPSHQQQHFFMATPPAAATQQQQHPVMMQYSVPTSSAAAPYMSYMLQPYSPIVAAAAAANYNNLVQFGQQQPAQPQRPIHHNTVHQQPVKLGLNKDYCYVPTSTTPTPTTSNTACLYNPFYGNVVAAAAHVQNQQPGGGGHRFPGNPPAMYPAPFIPRAGSGHNNYRAYVKPRRGGNRTRNFSNNDRSSTQQQQQQQQQQQHQSSDKNS